jgi:hypothetical protein
LDSVVIAAVANTPVWMAWRRVIIFSPLFVWLVSDWRREGDSNPRYLLGIHAFQACALNHSAISPPGRLEHKFSREFSPRASYFIPASSSLADKTLPKFIASLTNLRRWMLNVGC